jgi:hypothetical protein
LAHRTTTSRKDPPADAFERALAEERLRSTRQLSAFRVLAVTAFLGVTLVFRATLTGWVGPPLWLFALYWFAAVASWWASRRSDRLAPFGGLSVPFIDMPMLFLLLRGTLSKLQAGGLHAEVAQFLGYIPFYYVLLLVLASLTLETPQIYLASGVAAALCAARLRRGWTST